MMPIRYVVRRRVIARVWWVGLALVLCGFVPRDIPSDQWPRVGRSTTVPRHSLGSVEGAASVGLASWYSQQDPGVQPLTASGEAFDDTQMTAAMWEVPFGSCIQVVNLKTLERISVRVNDRGPHRQLASAGRVLDLSKAAFAQLADLGQGLIPVSVELVSSQRCISALASAPGNPSDHFAD